MIEGFWIVQYEGVQGSGGGVVVFLKGHVFGGDTGLTYTGTYQTKEKAIAARILVRNFLPEAPNVLGVQGDLELILRGAVEGKTIKAAASVANQEVAGIVVRLTKVSDLPGKPFIAAVLLVEPSTRHGPGFSPLALNSTSMRLSA